MRPKKVSDEEILQTVRRCLIEQGGSVSTQFIANQIGVSQATLFKRFGSKSNLLQTAILLPSKVAEARSMMELLSQGPTEAPVREQMERLCLRLLKFFDDVIPSFASLHASGLTFDDPIPEDAPPIVARKYLTSWIARLQEQGRIRKEVYPESIALTLIGAMQHRSIRIHLLRDTTLTQTDEEYVSSMVEVLWKGLSSSQLSREPKENS